MIALFINVFGNVNLWYFCVILLILLVMFSIIKNNFNFHVLEKNNFVNNEMKISGISFELMESIRGTISENIFNVFKANPQDHLINIK